MSFTLTFPAGPLGLTIAPAETTGHPSVVVKTVKPGCAHGARLRAGDELVAVGATSVRELCESATMDVAAFERRSARARRAALRAAAAAHAERRARGRALAAAGAGPQVAELAAVAAAARRRRAGRRRRRSSSTSTRSASAASLVDEIEAPEALDTGDDGLSAEVEQPETVAARGASDAAAPPALAGGAVAADGGPAPVRGGGPRGGRAAEREWAAFFAASVEQAATPRSDEDAAVAAAVFDFASEVLDPGEPGDDFPPLTSESSPYWPPPPEIVSEAPKSPEVADAEWRALKAGVVRSVVKAAEARLESTVPPAALRDTSDSRLFEHVLVVGASVRTVATAVAAVAARDAGHRKAYVATVDAQVVHAYPAKSLPLELAETVCCFCAPDGITCRGDSLSLKAEAAEAATESGGHATVSTSVMAFGGGGEPLYAVVLSGLQRRDAHRSKKQTAVVMRSDLRVVLCTRRASLLALHLAAGALLAQDVAAALAAASRAKASPAACVDAANAAVARFACAFARVPVPPPGVRARWAPPVAIDEQALVPGLVPATPSKRPRADEHAVEDRAPPAPPELSRRERGRRDGLKRPDVVYCRSRGDVEAGQSVWDGDGAAILEWALPVLLSRLRLSHVLRAVAALLAELTVVVECADESDCSACVLALLTLARPLHPAGPLIVVLPQRFADYLDSPVPVLVGVTYGGPPLMDRLRRPTSIPSLLARCDDDELRLFGGADPAVTTLPAADKLMNRLQAHADTIKRHVLRKGRRRAVPPARGGANGTGAPAPGGVAGVLPPPSPARRGSSAGAAAAPLAGPPTPRTTGGAVLGRARPVLAAASLELADGDRKEANLRALGLVHNAPEDTFLSPEDDEVNVPPWARCFVKSQLFANFRNALDEEGAAEWCNRLAAALKVDVDALATCRRALRRAPPAAIPADFASPASKRRWTSRGK
ncbi:hypothetical protein JL720_9838 [Aureococcus anophagefferens]|nr:hypothetical protein JL720_9838 [Aureococcus anophagefferens]